MTQTAAEPKKNKAESAPEDSIPLRIVSALLCMVAVASALIFGDSEVPASILQPLHLLPLLLCFWLISGGAYLSYRFRASRNKDFETIIKFGVALIILKLIHDLWYENMVNLMASLSSAEFQFLKPLLHALVGACLLTSFEVKTRNDINALAAFGLSVMVIAATSGRSVLYGIAVFLYLALGALLLYLGCASQSRSVTPAKQPLIRQLCGPLPLIPIAVCISMLPVFSVGVFSFLPRLDAEADMAIGNARAYLAATMYKLRYGSAQQSHQKQGLGSVAAPLKPLDPKEHPALSKSLGLDPKANSAVKPTEAPKQPDKPEINAPGKAGKPAPKASPSASNKEQKGKPSKESKTGNDKKPDISPPQNKAAKQDGSRKSDETPPQDDKKPGTQTGQSAIDVPPLLPPDESGTPKSKHSNKRHSLKSKSKKAAVTAVSKKKSKAAGREAKADKEKSKGTPKPALSPKTTEAPREALPAKTDMFSESLNDISLNIDTPLKVNDDPMFTLASTHNNYVRLLCMDNFDGISWTRADSKTSWDFSPSDKGVEFTNCPSLYKSEALPYVEITEKFTIQSDLGRFIPFYGVPDRVSLRRPLGVDNYGSLYGFDSLKTGDEYAVVATLPLYPLEQLRKAQQTEDILDGSLNSYLNVPDNLSRETLKLPDSIIDRTKNRFVQAEQIVAYLRANCKPDVQPAKSKTIENRVDAFLFETKKGDCKDFASAFVMLCRASHIPARIVLGFSPGEMDAVSGVVHYRRKHGHAWAEIWMPPYGWIPFDAVPGGLLPNRPEQQYYNYERAKQEVTRYVSKANTNLVNVIKQADAYKQYMWWGAEGLGGAALLYLLYRLLQPWFSRLRQFLVPRHPAVRVKDSVLKRLNKIGINATPADSGADLIAKLERAIENPTRKLKKPEQLLPAFQDFIETYNDVHFGQADRMKELKEKSSEVARLVR